MGIERKTNEGASRCRFKIRFGNVKGCIHKTYGKVFYPTLE
jgi:hypothetical protein